MKRFKEIGSRNSDDGYFEFHTEPVVRIEFATKDELREIRNQIEIHGWRTFDLT